MIYLKRLIFIISFLFLTLSYAAQTTMSSDRHTVNDKKQLIFKVLGNKFILNKSDIQKIELQSQDNEKIQSIGIQLTDDAAKSFMIFTGENIGQRIQLIWNGKVLSEAVIQSAMPGKMVISLDVPNSLAQEMVSNI